MTSADAKKETYFVNMYHVMKDIMANRQVLSALIKRNTAGRYKNSFLGFAWNMLTPILTILVLYVVFTQIRTRPIPDFWIYLCQGMFPVSFMSGCLRGRAILNNATYVTKLKFPREIAVIADAVTQLIPVIIVYLMVLIVIMSSGQAIDVSAILMLPVVTFMMFVFSLGCSFIVSTVCVFVRDVGHFLAIQMRLVIWITPTFFLASEATNLLGILVWYNPFTYFVECFHDIIYNGMFPTMEYLGICFILMTVVFLVGWQVFEHYKSRIVEVI